MTELVKVTIEMVLKDLFLKQYAKGYMSFNTVFTGFNELCRKHFEIDPVAYTNGLRDQGLISISGRKSEKNGRVNKSVLIWLTEKGMEHFGIRPQATANAKPLESATKKSNQLLADAEKRYILRKAIA
jgi:hypothetical protein